MYQYPTKLSLEEKRIRERREIVEVLEVGGVCPGGLGEEQGRGQGVGGGPGGGEEGGVYGG